MNRREALVLMGTFAGGTIFGGSRMMAGVARVLGSSPQRLFSTEDLLMLDEIGETILLATVDSGGAKAAYIGEFMNEIVRDFYSEEERAIFREGLDRFHASGSSKSFLQLSLPERHTRLLDLERSKPVPDYYRMMKQLTLWGFFTSEIGSTQALQHQAIPGRYEGCLTIDPTKTRAWSQ